MTLKNRLHLLLVSLYICTPLFFLLPHSVWGADYGLSISPPLLRVHIKPGKSITQVFNLENLSSADQTLVASLIPFTESDNQGNPLLNPKANASWLKYFSLANSQIKFDEPFTLPAGSKEQLILSLSVPDSAPIKDLYATLTISTYSNKIGSDETGSGSLVSGTIGSNLLVTVSSQPFPDTILKIENLLPQEGYYFKIGHLYFADSITPLSFTASVKNQGSFAAETKGVFRVSQNDRPIYLEGILPVNVIAKSGRQLKNVHGEDFGFSPGLLQIGTHQVTLEIKTDNSNTSTTIEVFFLPLKLFLAIFTVCLIFYFIIKTTSPNHIDTTK